MILRGVVLAAGRSTRMGRDKALLDVAASPLWRRQAETLTAAGAGQPLLSVRPEQTWVPAGWPVVFDQPESGGAGPLAGIAAAWQVLAGQATHLAVLAIDLPEMPAAWFGELLTHCRPGVGAVGRNDRFLEPLAAIYPVEALAPARAALASGRYALQPLVADGVSAGWMAEVNIPPAWVRWFTNWNEPAAGQAPTA